MRRRELKSPGRRAAHARRDVIRIRSGQRAHQSIEDVAEKSRAPAGTASGKPSPIDFDARTQSGRVLVDLHHDLVAGETHDFAQQRLRADAHGLAQHERTVSARAQHRSADPVDRRATHADASRSPSRRAPMSADRR